jgi:hypothetical protein
MHTMSYPTQRGEEITMISLVKGVVEVLVRVQAGSLLPGVVLHNNSRERVGREDSLTSTFRTL